MEKKPLNFLLWNQKSKLTMVLCSIGDVGATNFAQMMILDLLYGKVKPKASVLRSWYVSLGMWPSNNKPTLTFQDFS